MSIYASLPAPADDDHEEGCAIYVERDSGIFEFSGQPCSCGLPNAPLIYQGSNVLPSPSDKRGGYIDLAQIPSHITRDGRADGPEDERPWPYLRFGVNNAGVVVLTRDHVLAIRDELSRWLDRTQP